MEFGLDLRLTHPLLSPSLRYLVRSCRFICEHLIIIRTLLDLYLLYFCRIFNRQHLELFCFHRCDCKSLFVAKHSILCYLNFSARRLTLYTILSRSLSVYFIRAISSCAYYKCPSRQTCTSAFVML